MYKSPFEIDYNLPKCEGLMCENRGDLLKLADWNNPDRVKWYCTKCFQMEMHLQEEEKYRFLKHYKNEDARAWLSPKAIELYHRLAKEAGEE